MQENKKIYTPEMFGAKCDGITDDTKAVQVCIDAAFRDNTSFQFTKGVHKISATIQV